MCSFVLQTLEKVITERLEGKAITEHGISSFNTRIALARKLCDIAITYRRYGVVHADLTWENILVQVNPSEFKIVIIDFGISGYFPALNEHSATTSYIFRPTSRWIWPTPAPGGREQPQIVGQYLLKTYGALSHHMCVFAELIIVVSDILQRAHPERRAQCCPNRRDHFPDNEGAQDCLSYATRIICGSTVRSNQQSLDSASDASTSTALCSR